MYNIKKLIENNNVEIYDSPYYDTLNYFDNIRIIGICHDIDEKVIINRDNNITMSKIRYGVRSDIPYFISNGKRYFLNNFMLFRQTPLYSLKNA